VLLIFSEAIENLKIAALIDSLVSDDLYQISTNNFHADEKVDGTIQKAIEEFLNLYDHRIDSYLYWDDFLGVDVLLYIWIIIILRLNLGNS
jgi:hypothetical protein